MKSIRNTLNIVLSAIIVALGFGSCVSHRAYQEQKNSSLKDEIRTLEENIMKYRRDSEQRKVVYGPRPTSFQKDIAE